MRCYAQTILRFLHLQEAARRRPRNPCIAPRPRSSPRRVRLCLKAFDFLKALPEHVEHRLHVSMLSMIIAFWIVCNNFKRLGREGPKLLFWKPVDPGPVALAQRPSVDVRVPACPPFERRVLEYRVVAPPRSHLIW